MHSFTSFIAFLIKNELIEPFIKILQSSRIWGPPDSSMVFPRTKKRTEKIAISRWKHPSEIIISSNVVSFSSAWIYNANFAIAKSYVTVIFSFWPCDTILNDILIVSSTADAKGWLICGGNHIFSCGLVLWTILGVPSNPH